MPSSVIDADEQPCLHAVDKEVWTSVIFIGEASRLSARHVAGTPATAATSSAAAPARARGSPLTSSQMTMHDRDAQRDEDSRGYRP